MTAVGNRMASRFPEGDPGNVYVVARVVVRSMPLEITNVDMFFPADRRPDEPSFVSVDWGDTTRTVVASKYDNPWVAVSHAYSSVGEFVIKVRASVSDRIGTLYGELATDNSLFVMATDADASVSVESVRLVPCPGTVVGETDASARRWSPFVPRGLLSGLYSPGSLTVPEGVVTLGISTFEGCVGLKTADLPSTLAHLGEGCFGGDVLDDLWIRSGLLVPYNDSVRGGSVSTLHVPEALLDSYAHSPWADVSGEIVAIR